MIGALEIIRDKIFDIIPHIGVASKKLLNEEFFVDRGGGRGEGLKDMII